MIRVLRLPISDLVGAFAAPGRPRAVPARPSRRGSRTAGVFAVLSALLLGLALGPAAATESEIPGEVDAVKTVAASAFIHDFIDRGVAVLRDEALSRKQRNAVFHDFITESFDTDFAARFALGRGWRIATHWQRDEYLRLFRADMLRVGNNLFRGYKDETLEVLQVAPRGEDDLMVRTRLTNPRSAVRDVDIRLRPAGTDYRIVDVRLEGLSLLSAYRSEFVGRLFQGGVDGVIDLLRRRTASYAGLPG